MIEIFTNFAAYTPFFFVESFLLYWLYEIQWFVVDYLNIFWIFDISIWSFIFSILVVDLVFYWGHRLSHEVPILWIIHATHHSSRNFNVTTYFRSNLFEPIFNIILLFPLIFIGISPILIIFCYGLVLSYPLLVHTELVGKLGILEKFLVTPSNHRVHHGCNDKYMDKNYGGIFCIWDRLYGTYEEEIEEPLYGISGDFESLNPIRVTFSEFPSLLSNVKKSKDKKEFVACLFKRRVPVNPNT